MPQKIPTEHKSNLLISVIEHVLIIRDSNEKYTSANEPTESQSKQNAISNLGLIYAYDKFVETLGKTKLHYIGTYTTEFKRRFPLNNDEITEARRRGECIYASIVAAQNECNDQDVDIDNNISSTDIINTATPQGCVDISSKPKLESILDAYHTIHQGDDEVLKSILYAFLSTLELTNTGLSSKTSGDSGSGKSHGMKAGVKLLPPEIVVDSGFSDKALLYRKGKPGEVIYVDESQQISPDMCGLLKASISNFQDYTSYTTLDKDRQEFVVHINPRTLYLLSAVDGIGDEQLTSRLFPIGISRDLPETIDCINRFRAQCAVDGLPPLHITPEITAVREMLRAYLNKLFIIKIPWANKITWSNPSDFRLNEFVLTIIKASCVLNYETRTCESQSFVTVGTEEIELFTIIAEEQDFKAAMDLPLFQRSVSAKHRFTPSEEKVIRFLDKYRNVTVKRSTIIESGKFKEQQLTNIMRGRDGKSGLLFSSCGIIEITETETESSGSSESRSGRSKSEKAYKITNDLPLLNDLSNIRYIAEVTDFIS
jgi:hypothetical protein